MATIKLYKGSKSNANIVNYQCATFDFENAVIDQDYQIVNQATGTLPTTGEALKQIRIHVPLAGINFIGDLDEDPQSTANLVIPPLYTIGDGSNENPFDTAEKTEVPIGEKPSDWELHYMDKYYFRTAIQQSTLWYYNYVPAGSARSGVYYPTWDAAQQYYVVPNRAQIFYTDATGFFGVSRSVTPTTEMVQVLYNNRPYGSNNYYPGEFWWKANGAFGTQLFPQSLATSQKVMIRVSSSISGSLSAYSSKILNQMIRFTYEEETYTGIIVVTLSADGLPQEAEITALSAPFWREEFTPANGGPNSGSQGGHGSYSAPSDNRGDRNGQYVAGVVSTWNGTAALAYTNRNKYRVVMNAQGTQGLQAYAEMVNSLWSPSVWQSFNNQFFNPRDAVVTCHLMPNTLGPAGDGGASVILAAERALSSTSCATFTDIYTWKHIGSVDITEYSSSFEDYENTAIYIHLPYIGTKQLDIEAVMDGVLSVDYVSDVQSGKVTAWVWTQDRFGNCNYHYEFSGNCAQEVELAARDKTYGAALAGAAASTALRVGLAVATGGMSEVLGNMGAYVQEAGTLEGVLRYGTEGVEGPLKNAASAGMRQAGSSIANSMSAGSAGTAFLSSNAHGGAVTTPVDTQCFLLITRPQWSNPERYDELFGYPSDIGGTINSDFTGFLSCREIKLNSITATDTEKSEIITRMVAGVYV